MIDVTAGRGGTTFPVKVVPRASRNEIADVQNGTLRIRVTAPPAKGAANKALLDFLADILDVPKLDLEIISGHSSRKKKVFVAALSPGQVLASLQSHLPDVA
jgi:uncharacterized protein (TIGR00251 family)